MDILFPVGRMVGGNLQKLFQKKDNNGNPRVNSVGEPMMQCSFGVAIAKGPEGADPRGWMQTEWGQKIVQEGATSFPQGEYQAPTFAWKVIDGDSQIPNKKGKAPASNTGYPGHWIIWFSQGWIPKKVDAQGQQELAADAQIIPGYYVQVFCKCVGNKSNQSPGVFMNPEAVALSGYGDPIATSSDVDTTSLGFGQGQMPAGLSQTPVGVQNMPGMPVGGAPGVVPPQGQQQPPPFGHLANPQQQAPAPQGFTNPGVGQFSNDFLNGPPAAAGGPQTGAAAGGPPPVAPPQQQAPAKIMTAQAGSTPYEAYIQAGWTDDQLIAHGYMTTDVPF